jgi:hypothetical protein
MTTHSSITFTCDCETCAEGLYPCKVKATLTIGDEYADGRDYELPKDWHLVGYKHICPVCWVMEQAGRLSKQIFT